MKRFEGREMQVNCNAIRRQIKSSEQMLFALMLTMVFIASEVSAQVQPAGSRSAEPKPNAEIYQTIYLNNITLTNESNEVFADLRTMLPKAKVSGVPSQNAISIYGTAEDIEIAQKVIADIDRPKHKINSDTDHPKQTYRLTYTITEMDGDKRIGMQSYTIVAVTGEKDVLKQGNRVPVFVGTNDARSGLQNPQVQYVGAQVQYQDVGINIEATTDSTTDGLKLRSKIEQSSIAGEMSGVGPQDPVLHQTVLDGAWILELNKPLVLGSLDVQGSSHRHEIEVASELVR
jgi:type II secretory pathway component GspD/PulD (secretin)